MALKRRSALQEAEKLVARGRLEAAVKQYRKVLRDGPNDTGTLNRLGDLYARLNRVADAVEMFTSAADHFTKEGFFVKAIAIYKKIIRLDPTLIKVYETLADLYHRQGLVNEARAQYQVVADYYKQANNERALATVFEKMVELEPNNPSHRLKLAEFYCGAERIPEAMDQYQRIASFMLEHGKVEEAFKVYFGAFELKVDDLGFLTDVIVHLTDVGREDVARRLLDQAIQRNPDAVRVGELVDLPAAPPADLPVERRGSLEAVEAPAEPAIETPLSTTQAPSAEAVGEAEVPAPPEASEEPDVVELDLDQESGDAAALLGGEQPTFDSLQTPEPVASLDAPESVPEDVELVDLAELVSIDSIDVEPAPEPPAARDETGEFEIDLDELEEAAEPELPEVDSPAPALSADSLAESADPSVAPQPAADPAVRADELVTEAKVLSNYGLSRKSVELCETALEMVSGHVDAGMLLLRLHHTAERSEQFSEVVRRFAEDGPLPEVMTGLLAELGHSVEAEPVPAPVEQREEVPQPTEVETELPAGEDSRLNWLDEETSVWSQSDVDMFGEEDQFFDLAAELEEELTAEELKLGTGAVPQLEEQSIEEIVEGFKQGVAETLSTEDYDTHYNLGIAYREMGLVDEAIGEFQLAAKSDQYLVDCCSLLGASFLEKGFPDLAVKWYERGLQAPAVSDEEKLGLLYELGNVYLSSGDKDTAKETFAEIYGANSNYRDVVAKLEELRQD